MKLLPLHGLETGATLGVPYTKTCVIFTSPCYNQLPVWCETPTPHWPTVPCEYLRGHFQAGFSRLAWPTITEKKRLEAKSLLSVLGLSTCMHAAVWAFHSQAVKSSEPATTRSPRGCQSTHSMAPPGPSRLCLHLPAAVSQIPTCPTHQASSGESQPISQRASSLQESGDMHAKARARYRNEHYRPALQKLEDCHPH